MEPCCPTPTVAGRPFVCIADHELSEDQHYFVREGRA
jgi:hypothetical protein